MNRLIATTALATLVAVVPGVAFAGPATDVSQTISAVQEALNNISSAHNTFTAAQKANNLANLVNDTNEGLNGLAQSVGTLRQTGSNSVSTVWGLYSNLTQSSVNVANSATLSHWLLGDLNVSSQTTGDLDQAATNVVNFAQFFDGASAGNLPANATAPQSAINAANLLSVNDVNVKASQYFGSPSTQYSNNILNNLYGVAEVDDLVQEATNVANVINATGSVYEIDQDAFGVQEARNLTESGSGAASVDLNDTVQNATSASNLVTVASLTSYSSQYADQAQRAFNNAEYVGVTSIDGGNVEDLAQSAASVANSINVSGVANSVTQAVYGSQASKNFLSYSTDLAAAGDELLNSTQTATSASNLVTAGTLAAMSNQYSRQAQEATNVVQYIGPANQGSVNNLDQIATAATNLLTLNYLPAGSVIQEVGAGASQLTKNDLIGSGTLGDIIQTATNVANSVGQL